MKDQPEHAVNLVQGLLSISHILCQETKAALDLVYAVSLDPEKDETGTLKVWQDRRIACKGSSLKLCRQYNHLPLGLLWNAIADEYIAELVASESGKECLSSLLSNLTSDVADSTMSKLHPEPILELFAVSRTKFSAIICNCSAKFQLVSDKDIATCRNIFGVAAE